MIDKFENALKKEFNSFSDDIFKRFEEKRKQNFQKKLQGERMRHNEMMKRRGNVK